MSSRFLEYVESGPPLLDTSPKAKMHKLNASFRFTNTNVTIANTVRREILNHTPSVGFRTEPYDKSEVEIAGLKYRLEYLEREKTELELLVKDQQTSIFSLESELSEKKSKLLINSQQDNVFKIFYDQFH